MTEWVKRWKYDQKNMGKRQESKHSVARFHLLAMVLPCIQQFPTSPDELNQHS